LFVSLRLALVAAYARRGIHLPMILDDVFVNFDANRTKIAVQVLRDFARQGHQLMVFTCHEHIWRMFAEWKVDSRRIPNRFNNNAEFLEPVAEPFAEPEPQALIEPDTELEAAPEPVAVKAPPPEPEPQPIEVAEAESDEAETAKEAVEAVLDEREPDLPPVPAAEPLTEVEYWWHDEQSNGQSGTDRPAEPLGTNYSWPAEPMIHRPDWW
jgi:hypothetical protein